MGLEKSAITDLVMEKKLPLVITFSRETAPAIFESDVSRQVCSDSPACGYVTLWYGYMEDTFGY